MGGQYKSRYKRPNKSPVISPCASTQDRAMSRQNQQSTLPAQRIQPEEHNIKGEKERAPEA